MIANGASDALRERLKFCNCAGCGREVLGDSFYGWYYDQPEHIQRLLPIPVAGRIHGRPYCDLCLASQTARLRREGK